MKQKPLKLRFNPLWIMLVAVSIITGMNVPAFAQEKEDRADDRAAIQNATRSFIKAFEKGDAKAVASHWTKNGEYISGDGETIQGQTAIAKAYAGLLDEKGERKVTIEMISLRFPSKDTAIEEGFLKVEKGNEPASGSRYSVLHVREEGKWLMAVVREWPAEPTSLRDLDWLIGSWAAKREDAEVHTRYTWMWKKSYIRMEFTIKQKDRTISGLKLIGKDPQSGELRSWTFESTGGFGEAGWNRDGKKWEIDSAGVLGDGSVLAAKIILTPLSRDAFISHVISRSIDGEELEGLPPIRVQRVVEKK